MIKEDDCVVNLKLLPQVGRYDIMTNTEMTRIRCYLRYSPSVSIVLGDNTRWANQELPCTLNQPAQAVSKYS
jgi:hypothetical protein